MGVRVPAEYLEFIEGERVSEKTRAVLEQRMAGPAPAPGLLTDVQERTLRALVERVLPQAPGNAIDLAAAVMERLARGKGDGWRFDVLPADLAAYREGLDRLAARQFAELSGEAQDEVLRAMFDAKGTPEACWFEEVRGDVVSAWMAHPATYARIGYSGIGVGGPETKYKGYVTLGINERETWEPEPVPAHDEVAR